MLFIQIKVFEVIYVSVLTPEGNLMLHSDIACTPYIRLEGRPTESGKLGLF